MDTHDLLSALNDPTIRPPVKLLFTHLAARTNGTGQASMPVTELLEICGIASAAVLRRYRAALEAAGYATTVIHNGRLHWQIGAPDKRAAPSTSAPDKRENAPDRRENAPDRRAASTTSAPDKRENAPDKRENAPDRRVFGPLGKVKVKVKEGILDIPIPTLTCADPDDKNTRIAALLTDDLIGLDPGPAEKIAAQASFGDVLSHAVAWRRERAAGHAITVGALAWRIQNRPAPVLDMATLLADPISVAHLYAGDEAAAEHDIRRRRYVPAGYEDQIES